MATDRTTDFAAADFASKPEKFQARPRFGAPEFLAQAEARRGEGSVHRRFAGRLLLRL